MSSRRSDTSEQRFWLGANRYSSSCRDSGTNTICFAYTSFNRYSMRRYDTNSDSNGNGNSYG